MRKQIRLLQSMRRLRRAGAGQQPPGAATARNVAIIMDGNGRWAARRGLPLLAGHRAGTRALRRTVEAAPDLGVRSLAVYAFSTENWGRPESEVDDLMALFGETIEREFPDLHRQGVKVRFVGRRDRCPDSLRALMDDMEQRTAANTRLDLWVVFDYGSRAEILHAVQELLAAGADPASVDDEQFRKHLYAPEMPDPDLVIRTSGEMRMSNFLLWQSAYAEFEFTTTLWPDFGSAELEAALHAYAGRQRRFGGR